MGCLADRGLKPLVRPLSIKGKERGANDIAPLSFSKNRFKLQGDYAPTAAEILPSARFATAAG
jgi:hypothetical protein